VVPTRRETGWGVNKGVQKSCGMGWGGLRIRMPKREKSGFNTQIRDLGKGGENPLQLRNRGKV